MRQAFGDSVVSEGENYPAPPLNQAVASVCSMVAWGGFLVCMLGQNALPEVARNALRDNKMMVYGGLFMLHSVSNALVQTGAFEVTVDDNTVFSKLQSGEAPNIHMLVRAVGDHIQRRARGQE